MSRSTPSNQQHRPADRRDRPSRPPERASARSSSSGVNRRELVSAGAGATIAAGVGIVAWKTGLGFDFDGRNTAAATPTPTPAPAVAAAGTPPPTAVARVEFPATPASAGRTRIAGSDMVKEVGVAELRASYDDGEFSIPEYVEATLARIDSMDQTGPSLRAVIELNPGVMDIAEQLDEEARRGQIRGPLHGVPILVKDVFASVDAMRTTSGSIALVENEVIRDAFLVEQLRNAGAVLIGKTNLSEWSSFTGNGPAGWSSRGGQTVNPYITDHTAWGSSTGSAVAVAASYVPLAVGVETDGSIICPASACGVIGLKPTVGLVSRSGSIPITFTQDSPGPIGRTVEDVAYMLNALVGYDPEDMAFGTMARFAPAARFDAFPVQAAGGVDYTRALDLDGLKGARIGVCRDMFGFDPVTDTLVEDAIAAMEEAGAEIIEDVYMDASYLLSDGIDEANMMIVEFAWGIQNFIDTYMPGGPMTSLQDIVNFNVEHSMETLPFGGEDGLNASLYAGTIEDPWYLDLVERNVTTARDQGIDMVMDGQDLDALIAPATGLPTPLDNLVFLGSSARVPSMAGYPSLTLPVGFAGGLPAGMHMFGRAFSEETLLKLAYSLEQILQARKPPMYLERAPGSGGATPTDVTGGL